jgi:hypothetical protein
MNQLGAAPTFVLTGRVERDTIDYVEKCLEAAQLPPDHAMVWIDTTGAGRVHMSMEYGLGAERVRADATGASAIPTADECVEQLLWGIWSGQDRSA